MKKNGITLNGVFYALVPDTEEHKEILHKTSSGNNCANYCDLAHMCRVNTLNICTDIFLKDDVHFEYESICI